MHVFKTQQKSTSRDYVITRLARLNLIPVNRANLEASLVLYSVRCDRRYLNKLYALLNTTKK